MSGTLQDRRILLTRPAGQNEALAQAIAAEGGEPVIFPALAISSLSDTGALDAAAARLDDFDLAIFISPNAVRYALERIQALRTWPEALQAATIGSGSARLLRQHGIARVIVPEGRFDSEQLLAHLPGKLDGRQVAIFRGEGGRELLATSLRERGAAVTEVPCYRRACPAADAGPLLRDWAARGMDAALLTSGEGVRNLQRLLGNEGWTRMLETPALVPHPRIGAVARELGLRRIVETPGGDEGLLSALQRFWAKV